MIHPTAVIEDGARIGDGVTAGPYAVIEAGARVGDGCSIAAHAVVRSAARIGPGCRIDSFAVVGGEPNHLAFDPAVPSTVEIGPETVIRESVTVHRSIQDGGVTRIGASCFLMAGAHVAHDCALADRVVMANDSMLAGHVTVGADTFIGGNSAFHQFTRIGQGAMVGGTARITRDVAPFCLVGERDELSGLNLIGLRRRKAPAAAVRELKALYHAILCTPGQPAETAAAQDPPSSAEGREFLAFFIPSKRGYVKNVVPRG